MPMTLFAELTKQVHLINDIILSDMVCENVDSSAEAAQLNFNRHLLSTKHWFARISWANKKRYVLALLEDVQSAWALSLLLKSMWSCRPKDAVLSASEPETWSSYDQVPMDHNRTAQPVQTLAQVMKTDRLWFLSLEPETQALVLSELLMVSGGPVMWEVLRRAQYIFEKYREEQLQNLQECFVVNDQMPDTAHSVPDKNKKESPSSLRQKSSGRMASSHEVVKAPTAGQAEKELEASLAAWHSIIKSLRDSVKLEELEMTFVDGTKRKIWKVNRPKPEVVETVDFVQLLPSAIGKRILSFLPIYQLGDYARVNKYWAYLVDEFRAELAARQKIDAELEKLQELMLRHDTSMEVLTQIDFRAIIPSSLGIVSTSPSVKARQAQPSVRASEKSAGGISFRHIINEKLTKTILEQKPFRNLAELNGRLNRRGAADENIWTWCQNIVKQVKRHKRRKYQIKQEDEEGVLRLGNLHFPCPLMKLKLEMPLKTPLDKDPSMGKSSEIKRNISNATMLNIPQPESIKRYSLWTRDFSKLYPVFKIPSHQSPV